MRRFRQASAIVAGILFIAAYATVAFATIQSPAISGNAPGLHLVKDAVPTKEEKRYLAIQLICPRENTGRFELISANRHGTVEQYRVEYLRGRATTIQISYRKNTYSKFLESLNVDLTSDEPDSSASFDLLNGREFVEKGNVKLRDICNGSADARKKYRATLNTNLRIIGLTNEEYPSNF